MTARPTAILRPTEVVIDASASATVGQDPPPVPIEVGARAASNWTIRARHALAPRMRPDVEPAPPSSRFEHVIATAAVHALNFRARRALRATSHLRRSQVDVGFPLFRTVLLVRPARLRRRASR